VTDVSKEPTKPADPLSILSLAAGIAAVILALFSVMPLFGFCTFPLSAVCVLTSVISGIASLVRTTIKPELEGRLQALAGLGLSLLWGLAAALLFTFVSRTN
jgi:hypothetical protein